MQIYKSTTNKAAAVISVLIAASIASAILTGCEPPQGAGIEKKTPLKLSTPAGMAEYLKNLPAVKKVEEWQNQYAPGIIITTDHYQIHTTLLEPLMLRQVPAFMESAHKAYQKQLPTSIDSENKFIVYLFGSRSQWEDFTKTFTGPQAPLYLKIKKGAYYLNGSCVSYNIGRTRTFSVLAHEGWHQFNSRHFTFRLPSWLDEGVATTFESFKYQKGYFYFQPGDNFGRLGALKKTLLSGKMIRLKHLIALNPGYVISDSDSVLAFYAQSYALVRFLREEGYGKRLSKYHNLLLAALRGTWPLGPKMKRIAADRNIPLTGNWNAFVSTRLFVLYIDDDFDGLEKEYNAFCNKITYHIRLRK